MTPNSGDPVFKVDRAGILKIPLFSETPNCASCLFIKHFSIFGEAPVLSRRDLV